MPKARWRIIRSPEAEADLLNIWSWGARYFSTDAADRHLLDIADAADKLRDFPETGRSRDDVLTGLRSIVVYPTVLFYRLSDNTIEIVRVIDGRRNIAAIFSDNER